MPDGSRLWAFVPGPIPVTSTGAEPAFTSRDVLTCLNPAQQDATLSLMLFYEQRDPVGPYKLQIQAGCVRQVRVNDLIDPEAVPLGTDYGLLIESGADIVVQFSRHDTSAPANTAALTLAYPLDERSVDPHGHRSWLLMGEVPPASASPSRVASHALVLNLGQRAAQIQMTLIADGAQSPDPIRAILPGRRVARLPLAGALPLRGALRDQPYGVRLDADQPVIVQHLRTDTRQAAHSLTSSFGFSA